MFDRQHRVNTLNGMVAHLRGGESLRIPMGYDDFRALGETKHHEYYDGVCVVNPPSKQHVVAATELATRLRAAVPAGLYVYQEWGWHMAVGDFEPDVMVARIDDPRDDQLVVPPRLVVEVLSASTRHDDLLVKPGKYAEAGAPWYWVVDIDVPEGIEIIVFELAGAVFVEAARATSGTELRVSEPFEVRVDPAELELR